MTFALRRAGEADLGEIMALERALFPDDAWAEEMMAAELGSLHTHYLVARPVAADDHRLAGYAGLLAPRRSGQADVQTVAVAPWARRRGLGAALVRALLAEAGRRRAEAVFLEVREDNPGARRLYERLGFEEIGRRPRYYRAAGVDAVVMRAPVPVARTTVAEEARDDR